MPTGSPSQPFLVDLLSKSEYYPYGMKINELSYDRKNLPYGTGARFGYNGTHEQDREMNAEVKFPKSRQLIKEKANPNGLALFRTEGGT